MFEGNGVRTEPNAISAIGLTLHELATNATKYGALSNRNGKITVYWKHTRDKMDNSALEVTWIERGGPRIETKPDEDGTGFNIAKTLLKHARGVLETDWHAEGLEARIIVPITRRSV